MITFSNELITFYRSGASSTSSGERSGVVGGLSSLSLDDSRSSGTFETEVVTRQGQSGKRLFSTTSLFVTLILPFFSIVIFFVFLFSIVYH